MTNMMFRSEVELGKFLGSLDLIPEAYQAILNTNLAYEVHTSRSGVNVLAFNCSPEYTNRFLEGEFDLVSSEEVDLLNFISTKVNPTFSINAAAVELFQHLGDDIKELENKYINTPLIITGFGLGGYLAILSTLRLHHVIDVEESINGYRKTKRPLCITFGSPLLGDVALQCAIAERPKWKSRFLNVVAKKDPVASFFSSDTPYKPLGTFLFCTESGGHTTFEDQDSILLVLDAMKLSNASNMQICDYTDVLSSIKRRKLYRGVCELSDFTLNTPRAGITLQLMEIDVLDDISNDQIGKMEKKQIDMIRRKNATYASSLTLADLKTHLTYMEMYMKTTKQQGGYYDTYKNAKTKDEIIIRQQVLQHHHYLSMYWKTFVEEKDQMSQQEGARLRRRWLYGATIYRRIVEPLDIAEYYQKGERNYIKNRPNHYKLLEKWSNEDDELRSRFVSIRAPSLTVDSCFWAYVEEALILLRNLETEESNNSEKELEQFEAYVMSAIKNYSVSLDIFLEGSSFMKWWKEYKAYKGTIYASKLAQYMNNEIYKFIKSQDVNNEIYKFSKSQYISNEFYKFSKFEEYMNNDMYKLYA
ncbi:hypothetical protein SSX86_014597 [Deinandra increscens subsp. villosa]|uniref:Uncharacterized protein n=1 Tax=Deinandra increscens subsp. villosa TaxID=3103831 RepID=A0AAP0D278_9ASTR